MSFSEVICVWTNGILAYDINQDFFFVMYIHYYVYVYIIVLLYVSAVQQSKSAMPIHIPPLFR